MGCPIEERRFRRFGIAPEDILGLMAQPYLKPSDDGYARIEAHACHNVPLDAKVVGFDICHETRKFMVTIAHPSFDTVGEGALIPRFELEVSRFTLPILAMPGEALRKAGKFSNPLFAHT